MAAWLWRNPSKHRPSVLWFIYRKVRHWVSSGHFPISHFNESHLYVHDFTVHRGRTSIEAGGISLKVSDWLTSSGSTSFCLCISLPLLFLLHACESNYRLSFLVKKIQISIIESRWCGSMCVCGGEEGVRITGHLYLNEACVTRWSGHSMEPAGGC